jgi:hypothetical protein
MTRLTCNIAEHMPTHPSDDDDDDVYLNDDDVYLKKVTTSGVTKFNPTQKCRPAKGIGKRVNIQIIKDTDITEQPNNK